MRTLLTRRSLLVAVALAAAGIVIFWPELAHASTTRTNMPWEDPLTRISNSIKGPVAYAISLIGTVVTGAMLVWGGEINEFARRLIMLVLVISLIVFASNILTTLFNASAVV